MHKYLAAYDTHRDEAHAAFALLKSWCTFQLPLSPGCDTAIRLAWRIACGATIEEASAKEWLYRWNLAIKPGNQVTLDGGMRDPLVSVFSAPSTLGM